MSFMTFPIIHLLPLWFGVAVTDGLQREPTPSDRQEAEDERRDALFADVWSLPPQQFITPR